MAYGSLRMFTCDECKLECYRPGYRREDDTLVCMACLNQEKYVPPEVPIEE